MVNSMRSTSAIREGWTNSWRSVSLGRVHSCRKLSKRRWTRSRLASYRNAPRCTSRDPDCHLDDGEGMRTFKSQSG